MIIEFKIKNYRSIRDEISLNMEASGTKSKPEHVAEIITKAGKKYRLLKTAVIYGPNASGKSNIIRAFWAFRHLVATSSRNDINDLIPVAEPFELDLVAIDQPSEFYLKFIGADMYQYIYKFSVHKTEGIIEESLFYYPDKSQHLIFRRKGRKIIKFDDALVRHLNINNTVNPKRLLLSELANIGEVYWEKLRNYLIYGTASLNTAINGMQQYLTYNAMKIFDSDDNESRIIKEKVVNLLKLSDLGIKDVAIKEQEVFLKANTDIIDNESIYTGTKKEKRFKIYHTIFEDTKAKGTAEFDLINQGSAGSLALLGLSTEIIMALNSAKGKALFVDEIDNSLHPKMCKFLINLFHHPASNPHNAQLIFATHESTLLERNNFRMDQIWITSKDKYGVTDLYSVHDLDIEGLREDIPFDKWYLSGRFGGLPKINEMDAIYDRLPELTNG